MADCPCGASLTIKQKKYCSNSCKYQYRIRPCGLSYQIVKPNPSWFPPGVDQGRGFKRGSVPSNFKGHDGKYAYNNLHKWVKYHKGKASECVLCHEPDRHYHWANVSHEYKYDLDDWISLCVPCHKEFDEGHVGSMERVFGCVH